MRIDRFFVSTELPETGQVVITDEHVVHQWRKVLRLSPGAVMDLCDNSGNVFRGELLSYDTGAMVEIQEVREGNVFKPFTLYMAIIKKDLFEMVCEKATELGVTRIVPLRTDYTGKQNIRYDRVEKIVREASEQSERAVVPEIDEEHTLEQVLEGDVEGVRVLVARKKEGDTGETKTYLSGIMVGPEGGWSDKELKLFDEKKLRQISLGNQVLRAETAAIAGLACVLYVGSMKY